MTELRADLAPLPLHMRGLPIDARGYPVPWFVAAAADGVPDFRVADAEKRIRALTQKLCWVCGGQLARWLAFVLGPMCTITRTTTEPACHRECAIWSAEHCPFLVTPRAVRRDEGIPAEATSPGGFALLRNPGVAAVWITRDFSTFRDGTGGRLITVGAPERVLWFAEGRPATRAEVLASIESGLPALLALARSEGKFAIEALGNQVLGAAAYYPAAT